MSALMRWMRLDTPLSFGILCISALWACGESAQTPQIFTYTPDFGSGASSMDADGGATDVSTLGDVPFVADPDSAPSADAADGDQGDQDSQNQGDLSGQGDMGGNDLSGDAVTDLDDVALDDSASAGDTLNPAELPPAPDALDASDDALMTDDAHDVAGDSDLVGTGDSGLLQDPGGSEDVSTAADEGLSHADVGPVLDTVFVPDTQDDDLSDPAADSAIMTDRRYI